MQDFWDLWQFPNCVGAVDGRHCILQNFAHGASEWYNYKGSFSMILMAVADARYRLTYVDIGARGPHVMKPFAGQFLADSKIIFNYRLSRARRVVENVFAILSARWRVLRRSFIASKLTARAVIQAVVCLHNLLVLNEENVPPHQRWYIPPDITRVEGLREHQLPRFQEDALEDEDGDTIREDLEEFFVGPGAACAPWQWEHLLNP
ncbi:hypothetical protein ONE63_011415 [Megalurothrips usitatus]|uniref:DDE Tnp4 domain-containing protein n=1 Tax=Megalurothrips usitatus TaxID=439358 RepID=A0AAV7X5L6_9NEOP|nr:hypothetical protein ONE63_011415 [Megalurothrips usitatus]